MHQRAAPGDQSGREAVSRWECHCQQPPVLLGTYDTSGTVNIKARDRYWHVSGRVRTTCPRCGAEHTLAPLSASVDSAIDTATSGTSAP
jgi:hypothetical protein